LRHRSRRGRRRSRAPSRSRTTAKAACTRHTGSCRVLLEAPRSSSRRGKGWWRTPRRGGHLNSPVAPAPGRGAPINNGSPEGEASPASACRPLRGSRIESTRVPGAGAAGLFKSPPLRGVSSKERKISSGVAGYLVWELRIRNRGGHKHSTYSHISCPFPSLTWLRGCSTMIQVLAGERYALLVSLPDTSSRIWGVDQPLMHNTISRADG
jgi:hypothetical protein